MQRRILIVEDNATNRRILHNILGSEYEVLEAENGREALEVLHRKPKVISAVLLDIVMPVMDGFEVLRRMRDNAVLSQIPVIVATGSVDTETEVKALALGANDFVTKPYNPMLILHCLRNTINLRETASIINAIQRDKLTGLYNREAFFEKANAMIQEKKPGYYLMDCLDIDNFKVINDQYGALEGDRILRHTGKTINEDIQAVGGVCGRISADNFAVLYPAEQAKVGNHFLEKMRNERLTSDASRAPVAFSVGRYRVTDPSLSASAIYDRAYLAKQSVKGRYDKHIAYFDEAMRERLIREQSIIGDMDDALALGQFEVWFQPQFNHATGALIGSEALVRWRHPENGLIPPGQFIPVFEQNGFIYELDKYVWEQVCKYLCKWIDDGRKPLPVSVNISRYDAFRSDLVEVITGLVDRYRIPVGLLRLEITESAFANSSEQIILVVKRLVNSGFTMEIDDFGSGYSSLNTLKDVPANVLNLDMRFLESSDNSQRGGNILESIVRMAKWLDMSVIAEGVETIEQANFLKTIGCNYIQGFLYAKPMPAEEYENLARSTGKEQRLLALETVENLDNNAFWDPRSMDTLIFNSYVGGACIFEYHNGRIELLRANDKYAQVIGSAGITVEDALKLDWAKHLGQKDRALVIESLERSIQTGDEVTDEFVFIDLPGCPKETYLRSTMRVIANSGDHCLVYCTNENMTAQRQAERMERRIAVQLQAIMENISGGLSAATLIDGVIGYLFANDEYYAMFGYTKEEFERELPRGLLDLILPEDVPHVYASANASAKSHSSMQVEYRARKRDGSVIWARSNGSVCDIEGVGSPVHIAVTSDITKERETEQRIRALNENLTNLMNDMPGGFVRMRVDSTERIVPVYFNEGFCKLIGLTHEELSVDSYVDEMAYVHPDDRSIVREAVNRILVCGEGYSPKYRLCGGDGQYRFVMMFGRKTVGESGETFLNIYYSDMAEQHRQEQLQRELLDNLPCGAAQYAYDGKQLTAIHLNRRYRELVGRELVDLSKTSVLKPVYPDDRATLMAELKLAIRENRDIQTDLRLLCGEDQYRLFHVVGRVIPKGGDQYAVYACYTPLSNEATSYQRMLPVALSAVMGSSNDLAFVKDRDLHYICCSPVFARMAGLANESEIVGKSDYDLFSKDSADRYGAFDREILASGEPCTDHDEILPGEEGTVRHATVSKYPLFDAQGNVIGIYGIGRDTTETHEAFERLKLLTDNIPGGLASMEIDGDDIRLTYFNEGFYQYSGYDRETFAQKCAENLTWLVFDEDLPRIAATVASIRNGSAEIAGCVYRCHTANGGYRWFNMRGTVSKVRETVYSVHAVALDITEQKEAEERLAMSEEQFRIAASLGDRTVARYDIKTGVYFNDSELLFEQGFGKVIPNVPQAFIDANLVDPGSVPDFLAAYRKVREGAQSASATVLLRAPGGSFRWFRMDATTIFDADGQPSEAIMAFFDATEEREKENVYNRWQQSLREKTPESYTLFRCNLNKNASYDSVEGALLQITFSAEAETFNMRTMEYASQSVHSEDRPAYIQLLNSDTLLANYYRGKRSYLLEYREIVSEDAIRWLRLTVELVEYPDSKDVEAYMMYEDIDAIKRAQLEETQLALIDPLTSVLNRNAFADKVNRLTAKRTRGAIHALLMFDVDGFKLINDSFGHAVGDQALIDIANLLQRTLRKGDLVGRLGGDEFVVFLRDVPNRKVAARKARQICNAVRKSFSIEIRISASLGIAIAPNDGEDFETLYRKADLALYHVKATGKDNFAFFSDGMLGEEPRANDPDEAIASEPELLPTLKRRMLIVDDNKANRELLVHIFQDAFLIDTADSGRAALMRLERYGAGISVVLLDLIMPDMDGFAVLEKMRESIEMQSIPVIIVSGTDERETGFRSIKCGAADFVTKPVDPDLIRLRVRSAVSRAENERLRAQNTYLALQRNEAARYRAILENDGVAMAEYNCEDGSFRYDSNISHYIAGNFDDRILWDILEFDKIAGKETIEQMQRLTERVSGDDARLSGVMTVRLRTPSQAFCRFLFKVIKRTDEFQLGDQLILTFTNVGDADVQIQDAPANTEQTCRKG